VNEITKVIAQTNNIVFMPGIRLFTTTVHRCRKSYFTTLCQASTNRRYKVYDARSNNTANTL